MIEVLIVMFSIILISIYLFALFKLETYGDNVLRRLGHMEYSLNKILETVERLDNKNK